MTADLVEIAHDGHVRTLTLNSPHNRNALSSGLLDQLADGFAEATTDDDVRAIVLTGTGTVFCSGADLTEPTGAVTSRLPELLDAIRTARTPVIARVNGHARAGGLGLIAVADLAVAAAGASFAFSEVRVGVAPAMILVPAFRKATTRFLAQMTLTGETFDAARAAAAGLLSAVVDDEDALNGWVAGVISSILKAAPGAVAATKALLADLPERSWSDGLSVAQERSVALFAGAEAAEGMDAFLHKRAPSWDTAGS